MLIHYRHPSDPEHTRIFDTKKAFENCPHFFRGDRTLTEYTKDQINKMNDDLLKKRLLYFTYSYPVGNDIVIKNPANTTDAKEILIKDGFEDLSDNINCMTHKIFFKNDCFYCFVGWNRNDTIFNGSICIRKLWEETK